MQTIIREEAAISGDLSFHRFMELALYCPEYGYYQKKMDIGRAGDFYTSVAVGPLFGEMLAFQFSAWIESVARNRGAELSIVEAGAHDGRLAGDILRWLRERRADLLREISYVIVEPSLQRQEWQRDTLADFSGKVRWVQRPADPLRVNGIIFSNELLDAFPVHRLGWDAKGKSWFEWGVTADGGRFVWRRMAGAPASVIRHIPASEELLDCLPDGFAIEICPAAEVWWRETAERLHSGKLLTVDYGFTAEEFFQPGRKSGTLRAYNCHRVSEDLLANPGEQDITAHVNFSALQSAGEDAGLKTEALVSQAKFLTEIAGKIWKAPPQFGEWTPARTRQFQTLTHPEHLGGPFRILLQSK